MKKDKEWLLTELRNINSTDNNSEFVFGYETAIDLAVELVNQLDEPEKVVVPQFVADYIEFCKGWNGDRQEYIEEDNSGLWFALHGDSCGIPNSVSDWLFNEEKVEMFARAWLDGYEVRKEKLYRIELPSGHVMYNSGVKEKPYYSYIPKGLAKESPNYTFTEKEIKAIDEHYWPFAVPVEEESP